MWRRRVSTVTSTTATSTTATSTTVTSTRPSALSGRLEPGEQQCREPEADREVDPRRGGEDANGSPAGLAHRRDAELQADRDEREDEEQRAQVVHRRDRVLRPPAREEHGRDDRRGQEAEHELREPLPQVTTPRPGRGSFTPLHHDREI